MNNIYPKLSDLSRFFIWTIFFRCWVLFFLIIQILIGHSASNSANSGDPDQMLGSAACDLGLHCLPPSHKKDARLIYWFYSD